MNRRGKFFIGLIGFGVIAAIFLIGLFMSLVSVKPGYVGVIYDRQKGGIQEQVWNQGWHFKMPIRQSVTQYPVSTQTLVLTKAETEGSEADDSFQLPTKENQNVNVDCYLTYHVDATKAGKVYTKFRGADIESIASDYIRTNMKNIAQNVSGRYSVLGIAGEERDKIATEVTNELNKFFEPDGIVIERFSFGEVRLPQSIEASVNSKIEAAQQAQQAELILKKNQIEAEQAVAIAKGKAEAMKIEAQAQAEANKIIANSLTDQLVKLKAIEKFNDKVQIIYTPTDSNIFVGDPLKKQ